LASPTNSLVEELKAGYSIVDPTSLTSEIQRDFFYETTNSYRFDLLSKMSSILNDATLLTTAVNFNTTLNNLLFYLFNVNYYDNLTSNNDLYKNQFRPMRKGISNMIRLHATGAIAMPTEIRLHILASSKDIIHSWSIPSAGIKIDCVPGYSSHRVTIFLVSGIF
jgi:heme/copper-type cytochrome/quinol oxidase subunit 2